MSIVNRLEDRLIELRIELDRIDPFLSDKRNLVKKMIELNESLLFGVRKESLQNGQGSKYTFINEPILQQ